ncbi:hypothetical protein M8J77_011156 [Diaphorina citri]|nr:hypothetical protein M8J77_011156 [Diaphorina citri]
MHLFRIQRILELSSFQPPGQSGDDDDSTGPVNLSAPLFPLSFSPSTPDDLPPLPPTGGQHSAPANSYLQELTASGFWSFNDSIDLTKYEQFDHSKFLGQYPSGGLDLTLPAQTTARPPAPLQSTPAPSTSGLGAPSPRNMPVFDNTEITNVTAQLGTTAFLPCRVRNLGERASSIHGRPAVDRRGESMLSSQCGRNKENISTSHIFTSAAILVGCEFHFHCAVLDDVKPGWVLM